MPAQIKVYKNSACTEELTSVNGEYIDDYGSPPDGQETIVERWVKNVGDMDAPALSVVETADPRGYIQYSANGTSWGNSAVLGDMTPGSVKKIFIKVAIPLGATESYDVQAYYKVANY